MSKKRNPEKPENCERSLASESSNEKMTRSNYFDPASENNVSQMNTANSTQLTLGSPSPKASRNADGSLSYSPKSLSSNTNVSSCQYQTTRYADDVLFSTTHSQHTKYNHGQCGLENVGNTCFMNSILQCLNNVPPFVKYYLAPRHRTGQSSSEYSVSTALASLLESMKKQYIGRSNALKSALCRHVPQFLDFNQQDSHEYLTLLLDALHRESSTKREDGEEQSIVTDIFQGQMEYTIKCSEASRCQNVTVTTDPFLDIPVFIEDAVTSSSPIFKVRFFTMDWYEKVTDFPYLPMDTIQSIIDYLQKPSSHSSIKSIIAMKISTDNTFSVQYRSLVPLSQIDDQSTIFYEIDQNDTNPITICLFLERDRSSLSQIYNWPPLLLKVPEEKLQNKLSTYLSNHFGSHGLLYDIGDDPLIHTSPTYLSSVQKTIVIHMKDTIIRQSQSKLEPQSKKLTGQAQQHPNVTLEQCLKNNISVVERMSSNSTWFCSRCKQDRQLTKENHILSLPQVLIIHLKRFNMESRQTRRTKIETFVKYPLELNMITFLSLATSPEKHMYDLIGVCLHSGSFEKGHYTAYTKKTSSWFRFNDSSVDPISVDEIVNRNAYILFYLRRD